MGKQYLQTLIRKLLRGKATDAEKRQLESWWKHFSDDDSYLRSLSETERQSLRNTMLSGIWQQLDEKPLGEPTKNKPKKTVLPVSKSGRVMHLPVVRWAAAAIVLLVSGLLLYPYLTGPQTIRTSYGEQRTVELPDGSVVTLNGNSSLRFSDDWDETGQRDVWLEGEAFFGVQHTRNHQKFIVHTPDQLAVEVLGTRFNVQNRRGTTQVVLQEGKVRVTNPAQQTYTLKPGDEVRYTQVTKQLTSVRANLSHELAWRTSILLFTDQPVSEVLQEIRDSHGLQVELRNPTVGRELFSGSIPADDVKQVLSKIEKIYKVTVTFDGDHYIIE
ncbi:FecR family protein [Larkinella punicea]|nr:FecR domain-containing protein [Larkinella punicea]